MALDDFADIDEAALGGLDDLFDEPSSTAAPVRPDRQTDHDAASDEAPPASPPPGAAAAADAHDANASDDDVHFLDAAAIDEELLSSVEDVLSELDDLERNEEELFGLQSALGAQPRRPRNAERKPDFASSFPDIYPVEPVPDAAHYGSLLPRGAVERGPRRAWLPTASILAANLVLLVFAWGASRSLRAGLRDVRDELDLVRATAPSPDSFSAADPAAGTLAIADDVPDATARDASAPLPAFDEIALEVARREVERGLYTSARRRLYAVLALADRIEPGRRADVEARTGFLVADSYRLEAETRREVAR